MKVFELVMPQLGVNDDKVLIVDWLVRPGQRVEVGQSLAMLETTKTTTEFEAEVSGYVYPLVEAGQEVPVRALIGLALEEPSEETVAKYRDTIARHKGPGAARADHLARLNLTAKARRLIEETGVDVSSLPTDRVIRESDVQPLLEQARASRRGVDALRRVAVYGASQGGITLVETIQMMGGYDVVAFLDDTPTLIGTGVFGLPVWPGPDLETLHARGIGAIASHIAVREFRLTLRDRAARSGLVMLNVIHPRAYVAPSARLGVGNVIKAGAIVDTEAQIGDCCIIDNGVVVPHHNVIADGCHLAPGVSMGGDCRIGERTLVGIGATISARVRIGAGVIISPGSVVVRDVPDNVVVAGSPAKVVGERR